MSRGGARKGAGRKPTGKTRAPETFSLKLSTLSALEQSVPGGRRSGFVDSAICAALGRLQVEPTTQEPKRAPEPLSAAAMPVVPRPFETI